jgi:pimeloyl-ACP methyl ester carboxylesterase
MLKLLGVVALLVVVGYLAVCGALYASQRSLLYFPQPRTGPPTGEITLPGIAVAVRASVRSRDGPQALLYFGGNGEDVSQTLPELARTFPDHAIYAMHYRGYGRSDGSPSEAALQGDALALYDLVSRSHARVSAIGRSLGSGIAIRVAGERPVSRLVLVTPYDSIAALASAQFRWLPVRWLLQDPYESVRVAPAITVPTTLVAAEHDEVIPRASTERLLAAFAPGVATMIVIPAAGHNDLSRQPAYGRALRTGF